jgi:hypothetical protein
MAERSRIRFNPGTKEIEVEGSESFVKTYFSKLQAMLAGAVKGKVKVKKAPRAGKPATAKRAKRAGKKAPAEKRATNIDTVVSLIQGAPDGISTTKLKEKTGLAERQIWGIVNRATKQGKIRTVKHGLYGGVATPAASPEEKTE